MGKQLRDRHSLRNDLRNALETNAFEIYFQPIIDYLKIDKSFIQEFERRYNNEAIVQGVIGMGRRLGVEIIAEGVERPSQESLLRQHGCDMGQRFLYLKPIPIDGIIELLKRERSKSPVEAP